MTTSPFTAMRWLAIAADAGDAERVYLLLHVAAYILLAHASKPFATFVKPRMSGLHHGFRGVERRVEEQKQADVLAHAMLLGCDDRTWCWVLSMLDAGVLPPFAGLLREQAQEICRLLPGYHTAALWGVVSLSFLRQTVILGLKLGRRL